MVVRSTIVRTMGTRVRTMVLDHGTRVPWYSSTRVRTISNYLKWYTCTVVL
jgi:hypothetical protein